MQKLDNAYLKIGLKIHFIGIGGISMSGLAEILIKRGCIVSGSDIRQSHLTQKLEKLGAKISIGHSRENIQDQDLIVYSAAIKDDNPEILAAKDKGICLCERAELLGCIMKGYEYPIAVSGTHGKTTTTSMLAHILLASGADPTISLGGELPAIGGNIRAGANKYFVTEACEYHQSFLKFSPLYSIILNIEEDHLDYFRDLNHIIETFRSLALLTPKHGAVIANALDDNVKTALSGVDREIITFGFSERPGAAADWTASNVNCDEFGCYAFDVLNRGRFVTRIKLNVPGTHNISNALAAVAACARIGINKEYFSKGLGEFYGTKRRFERKGMYNGAMIIDDYAHHPTEIRATLSAVKSVPHKRIWCVFQPHTYTRTKSFLDDFAAALTGDINVIITDIYAAREKDTGIISAKDLAHKIPNSIYIKDFDEIVKYLKQNVKPGDIVITMGAGNVYEAGEKLTA